jgi:transcriptional activator of cad operon
MPRFRVGDWTLDTADGTLVSPLAQKHLEPRVQAVLLLLIERCGTVVSHDDIFREVWRDTHVASTALPRTISMLRQALDDDVRQPRYIETVPKRGYRLIASVEPVSAPEVPVEPELRSRPRYWLAVAAVFALAVLGDHDLRPMLFGHAPDQTDRPHEAAVRKFPPGLFHQRLWHDTRLGNETGFEYYTRELARDPNSVTALAGLATVYTFRAAYMPDSARWASAAVETAQRAVTLDPSSWTAVRALAMSQWQSGRMKDAARYFERALELVPDDQPSRTNLGYVLALSGQFDAAFSAFDEQLAAAPRWPPGFGFPAAALAIAGYEREAVRLAETAIELEPFLEEAQLVLIRMDLLHGRYERARMRLQRLLEANADCLRCELQIGLVDQMLGHTDEARRQFERLRTTMPSWVVASLRLAQLRMMDGDVMNAETLLSEVESKARSEIDRGVDSSDPRWLLAAAAAVRGDHTKAILWYRRAVNAGGRDINWDEWDPLFSSIRRRPEFLKLRDRIRDDRRAVAALAARIAGRYDVDRVVLR